MMKKLILLVMLLMGTMLLGGCVMGGHAASGPMVSRSFDVGDFDSISIGGSREIIFRQSESSSVTIEMQESLFEILEVYVSSGTLHVYTQGAVTNAGRQRVYVYAPTLVAVTISGSATATDWDNIQTQSFQLTASGSSRATIHVDADDITVTASGSGRVELSGRADTADITTSGSRNVLAFDLQTQNADVRSSGSSRVEISVSDSLDARSSGSSRVRYRGNPSITQSLSGSASVGRDD